jgi:succinate dehydrogenase/fumarate reductase flavoprotein subunit
VRSKLEEGRDLFDALRSRTGGPDWREANVLLQQVMWDYAGLVRSETLLEAGLRVLLGLRDKARKTLMARNSHELMRALEVLNMIEIAAILFLTARERRETRGKHIRPDYPFANPLLEKLLVVRKADPEPRLEWRKMKR